MTSKSEKRNFIRRQNHNRPKRCPSKKECIPLNILQYPNGFNCCGLLKQPIDLDCIKYCISAHERKFDNKRMTNKKFIFELYLTVYEALEESALLSGAIAHYYAFFDNEDYCELIKLQVKNATKRKP